MRLDLRRDFGSKAEYGHYDKSGLMQKDPGPSIGVAGHSYELVLEMIGIIFDLMVNTVLKPRKCGKLFLREFTLMTQNEIHISMKRH
ncbi:MAG TPA: hypothetical protein DIW81_08585 [Planctomycetaceae bacterium]|nr:hypothetical protein [Rubinisphaera sp.]HCS51633.1 hypothetical protein [Planctomycetaceae bacterium]|tara:strand:- start:15303 stop:15563 length:261 start_codon:yes stop_codon:yes gene_type:complete